MPYIADQKKKIRIVVSTDESADTGTGAKWTKANIDAAAQAIRDYIDANPPSFGSRAKEKVRAWLAYVRIGASVVQDYFDLHKAAVSSDIEAASPGVFSASQKQRIFQAVVDEEYM